MMTNLKNQLQAYAKRAFPELIHPQVTDLNEISQGWENEMYAFDLLSEPYEERQELVLRLYSGDNGSDKARREYTSMQNLNHEGYPVPRVLTLEHHPDTLGKPFIIMERIPGEQMWPLMEGATPQIQAELMTQFCQLFLDLHNLEWEPFVENPSTIGPYTFVDGWFKQAENAVKHYDLPDFDPLIAWLQERRNALSCPKPSPVHFDFHPGNIIIQPDGSAVVIDWTGFQVSDHRLDLSWTLLLTRAHASVEWRNQILAGYERLRGATVEYIEIFEVFACARRLFDLTISLTLGPERRGMRPEAVALMRQMNEASQRVYKLMNQRTGIRILCVERVLEVNP